MSDEKIARGMPRNGTSRRLTIRGGRFINDGMNAKRFLTALAAGLCLVGMTFAQTKADYVKSARAVPSSDDYSDLSKLTWSIRVNGKVAKIDSHGKMTIDGKTFAFATDMTKNDLVSGIEYAATNTYLLIEVGYDNFDSAYGAFYKLDSNLTKNPELIVYAAGMGANQFLFNGANVFEASQFSFRLFDVNTKKELWKNESAIGSDYHYKNIVTYLGDETAKVDYLHNVDGTDKIGSMKVDMKTGKILN
jgi:hypothetical protein